MRINSYGWIILIILCVSCLSYFGGQMNYTLKEMPTFTDSENPYLDDEMTQYYVGILNSPDAVAINNLVDGRSDAVILNADATKGTFNFIKNLAFGNIEGMPLIFTALFDCIPFFLGWIIYRQIRGQD